MKTINKLLLWSVIFLLAPISVVFAQNYPERNLGWTLSAQTYTFRLFTFEEALSKAKESGLKSVEAYFGQPIAENFPEEMSAQLSTEGKQRVKELLKAYGIDLVAFGVVGASDEEGWKDLFSFANEMNVGVINVEPDPKFLSLIAELASTHQVKVAVHNHPKPTRYWDPEVVLSTIAKVNSPWVGACADVGHWVRSGLDPIECLKKFEGVLFSLHMKDLNKKDRNAHDVHWGTGVTGIKEVIQELKRQGFEGNISCEYEYNWEDNQPDVKQSISNFRKML